LNANYSNEKNRFAEGVEGFTVLIHTAHLQRRQVLAVVSLNITTVLTINYYHKLLETGCSIVTNV
jgi:hypothetical protein